MIILSANSENGGAMRYQQSLTIARFTLLEAVRTHLPWQFLGVLAVIVGAAYFIQELAITESSRMQIAISAAATRFAAVFVLSLHVVTSMVREFNDKGLELTLSFDLRRSDYVLGRLLGFVLIAIMLAAIATLPQIVLAEPQAAAQWGLSLALELAIVTALSLFCIVTFTQPLAAASFVFAFYLLARALTAIRLMSDTPLVGGDTFTYQVTSRLLDAFALVLPPFDRYTQSTWLIENGPRWVELGTTAGYTALYVALLTSATMFDFYRRNL